MQGKTISTFRLAKAIAWTYMCTVGKHQQIRVQENWFLRKVIGKK